jgi:hypothetical protein
MLLLISSTIHKMLQPEETPLKFRSLIQGASGADYLLTIIFMVGAVVLHPAALQAINFNVYVSADA